ncbi:T9SS type A sorting domain-containing protein [candidate division KSB1 bacterium]
MLSNGPRRATASWLRPVTVLFLIVSFTLAFAVLTDSQDSVALAKSGKVIKSDDGRAVKAGDGNVQRSFSMKKGAPSKADVDKAKPATLNRPGVPPYYSKIQKFPKSKAVQPTRMARQAPADKSEEAYGMMDVGFWGSMYPVNAVAVSGNLAYLGLSSGMGLMILDITDPMNILEVGSLSGPDYSDVHVDGTDVYATAYYAGLDIIDAYDPANPILRTNWAYSGQANGVFVEGETAYIAGESGMVILDIATPNTPSELSSIDPLSGNWSREVVVSGTYAYLATDGGLAIVDVTNPASPVYTTYFDYAVNDVAVSGNIVSVVNGNTQIIANYDVSDPYNPSWIGSLDIYGSNQDIAVSGGYAFVTGGNELRVIDISDPMYMTEVDYYTASANINDVFFVPGDHIFLAQDYGLDILEFTTPKDNADNEPNNSPDNASTIDTPNTIWEGHDEFGNWQYARISNQSDWETGEVMQDIDWYTFDVPEAAIADIRVDSWGNDTDLRLAKLDETAPPEDPLWGRLQFVADNRSFGGSADARLVNLALEPGTYYLRVRSGYLSNDYQFDYELHLEVVDPSYLNNYGQITGNVSDDGGTALPGIRVIAFRWDPWREWERSDALTDAAGNYVIYTSDNESADWYVRTGNSEGYVDHWWVPGPPPVYAPWEAQNRGGNIYTNPGQEVTGIDFDLVLGGNITGFVYDEAGIGVAGARVQIERWDYWRDVFTEFDNPDTPDLDETGQYNLWGIPPGDEYVLMCDPPWDSGLMFEFYSDQMTRWEADRISIVSDVNTLPLGNDFNLNQGGSVTGTVTDEAGNPQWGSQVVAIRANEDPQWAANSWVRDAWTDDLGNYTLSGLPYDDYKILAKPPEEMYRTNPGDAQEVNVIAGLAYSYYGEDIVGNPTSVARFSKAAVLPVFDAELRDEINIPLPEGSTITGKVEEQGGREVQENVNINAYFADGFEQSPELAASAWADNMSPWYEMRGLPPERYILVAAEWSGQYIREYYQEKRNPEELSDSDIITIFGGGAVIPGVNFTVEPGATIKGVVTDSDGLLIDIWGGPEGEGDGWSDAWVGLMRPDGTVVRDKGSWFPNMDDPSYQIDGIIPGEYYVFASAPGYGLMFFDPVSRQAISNFAQASPLKLQGGAVIPGVDFMMAVAEPSVALTGNYTVDDLFTTQMGWDPMGDGDMVLEPGEWALIQPEVINTGNAFLRGIYAEVSSRAESVLVDMDGGFWIDDLPPGATVSAADVHPQNGIFGLALSQGTAIFDVEFYDNIGQFVGIDSLVVTVGVTGDVDEVAPLMFLTSVAKSASERAGDLLDFIGGGEEGDDGGDDGAPVNAFGGHFTPGSSAYLGVISLDPSGVSAIRGAIVKGSKQDAIVAWYFATPNPTIDLLLAETALEVEEITLLQDPALTDSMSQEFPEEFVGVYLAKYTVPDVEDDFFLGLWGVDGAGNETAPGVPPMPPTWANSRKILTTKQFRPTAGVDILLVSDDRMGEYLPYYTEALDAGGYAYDIWSRNESGPLRPAVLDSLKAKYSHQYEVIVWYSGGNEPILSESEQMAVGQHLKGGGKLFITDQDLAWDMTENSPYGHVYQNLFKGFFIDDWSGSWKLGGSSEHPISEGMFLNIQGGDGANNQDSPDVIGFDPAFSTPLFFYEQSDMGPIMYRPGFDDPMSGGQIGAMATEYLVTVEDVDVPARVVNFAFGFEAIDNGEDRAVLMDRIIAWLTGSEVNYVLYGDVSANGRVQAFDAALILQHVVGINTLPEEIWTIGDVDGSGGEPGALDAALVLQYVAKLIDVFPVLEEPAARKAPLAGAKSLAFMSKVAVESGREVAIPLQVGGAREIMSAQLALKYDPNVLAFKSVKLSEQFEGFLEAHKASSGQLKLALAGNKAVEPGVVMADLIFEVVGSNGSNSSLTFESFKINDQVVETADLDIVVGADLPRAFALSQNYPNPFNPETVIAFALPLEDHVVLDIYNISGQMVRRLVDQRTAAGFHKVRWDGKDMYGKQVTSGIYFYRVKAGSYSATKKMTVLK